MRNSIPESRRVRWWVEKSLHRRLEAYVLQRRKVENVKSYARSSGLQSDGGARAEALIGRMLGLGVMGTKIQAELRRIERGLRW